MLLGILILISVILIFVVMLVVSVTIRYCFVLYGCVHIGSAG